MHRMLVAVTICLVAAQPAGAGAWLRGEGQSFLAVSTIGRSTDGRTLSETETALYAEHGLTPRLTLGADINDRYGLSGHALLFARLPLGPTDRASKWALELGTGGHHQQGHWGSLYKATLAYGYSFETARGFGWLGIETALEMRSGLDSPVHKLDATLGLPLRPGLQALLQVETSYVSGQRFAYAITPGVILGRHGTRRWHLGIEHRRADRRSTGVKLALWLDF